MILTCILLTACIKLMLIPAYRSTDFEVHRNWLAITYSLPIDKWYFENTSEWTLDYPPFFAWFEYLLSLVAALFDKNMLDVSNINYASERTVLFQRLSVIVTDLIYAYGTYRCCHVLPKGWRRDVVLPILLLTNCGLLMVDHIHFQYNGVMYGFLLLSISFMLEGKYLWSAFWFTFLLNMKHIYLYLAPAYFVYLLRHYCMDVQLDGQIRKNITFSKHIFINLVKLGLVVVGVFIASFLPFAKHIGQVLIRLFPFKRGLCHAYWAPNIWALYNTGDKIATVILSSLDIQIINKPQAVMTGGLVQEFSHSVLPSIAPLTTMLLTLLFMLPALLKLFFINKQPANFLRCLVLCGLTSFIFGWHVHEKAILMTIVPMSILSVSELPDAKVFLILSTVGHYSLFPLLFPSSLLLVKVLLLLLYSSYAFYSLYKVYSLAICKYTLPLLNMIESVYILGLGGVFVYENFVHKLLDNDTRLPFLPLMITSVYCAIGIMYCWVTYYLFFLNIGRSNIKYKANKEN
ncbi:probable dolichyl pyrophosphate Glc1Man9GlcNAc2 alpha-1,3-glucosyltransferase [Cylas formicarius]|uniref:probable dolichyl pyrophosphate Glc1Man9GlcNAc2 alpha-1,3-glucosyltransferase n=1 Tax=Cylas formicarius TaxID=197179 RepID=UPI002958732D|nr:probable dolichyl pyrophosphate Glc1Man9GlcNAc2 alpha-1,3-glucosyltransferase [Cylas formicarius]